MQFKSAFLDKASGAYGGVVASRNRFGQYFRQRANPVNPSSSRQQLVRSTFAALAAYWSEDLTQAQRDAWNLYANSVEMVNRLGDPCYYTGFNHFIRSNSAILQGGGTQVDDGPTNFSLPVTDPTAVATVTETSQQISLAFNTGLDWVGEDGAHLLVLMSQPKGVGVEFLDGPFRYAGVIDGDATTPPTSPQTITVPFAVTELQKGQIQCRIARADGRVSTPFRDTFAVGA
jgi:hypothetical protein